MFDGSSVLIDQSALTQNGRLRIALPIGWENERGNVIWSNQQGSMNGWTMESEPHPNYFKQDIVEYLQDAEWKVEGEGFEIYDAFPFKLAKLG